MRDAEGMGDEAPPLRVGAALPDPPFEIMTGAGPTGFDVALMQRIAAQLGRSWQLVRYTGADFNGIFAGLDEGSYDCVASGTTITPDRDQLADFCPSVQGRLPGNAPPDRQPLLTRDAVHSRHPSPVQLSDLQYHI